MMRLDNISGPIAENLQAHIAGFLWMKLHAGNVAALDGGADLQSVLGDRGGVVGHGRSVGMREVDLRSILHAMHQASRPGKRERVPSDMWNLQAITYELRKIETGSVQQRNA